MSGIDNQNLIARRAAAIPNGHAYSTPYFAAKAQGAEVWDVEGKRYIDFVGGIGVVNVGHANHKVVQAVKDQAEKFLHTCFHIVMYEGYVELAERLNRLTPGDFPKKTLLVNTGAECIENAVKISRYATGRSGVIVFEDGFHGRTLLTMSMSSKVKPYKYRFGPFAPEVYRMPYAYCYRCGYGLSYPGCGMRCAHALEDFFITNAAAETTACLVAEPILGEGGFVAPPPEFFPIIKGICEKHGIVFVADEVQSGVCRTGKMFAMEHYGIAPDITACAKSLAAGMPLGAVVGRAELMEAPHPGGLGGTYGGNPVSCAAALAVLDYVEENDLAARGQQVGDAARARFLEMAERYPIIGDVRGLGAMLALELVTDRETKEPATQKAKDLMAWCHQHGLITLACGRYSNVIRTLMPLVITDDQLREGLDIMEKGLAEVSKS